MTEKVRNWTTGIVTAFVLTIMSTYADAQRIVDLELVIAVDVSHSINAREQRIQRDGYVAAFTNPSLIDAILSGANRRIAVTYFEWAGLEQQSIVVPWRMIQSSNDALNFAQELTSRESSRAMMTSISGAILKAKELIESNDYVSQSAVVDISGDGPNNDGPPVSIARDLAVASGITINALSIQLRKPTPRTRYLDIADLAGYFKSCVIGGQRAFVISVTAVADFNEAILQKLIIEVAGANVSPATLLRRVSSDKGASKHDCLIGEKLLKQYFRERFKD